MEKGHRTGKVAEHKCCHGGTWYVMLEEEEMQKTLGKYELWTPLIDFNPHTNMQVRVDPAKIFKLLRQ